jgi:hypothetical protein
MLILPKLFIQPHNRVNAKEGKREHYRHVMPQQIYSSVSKVGQ